MKDVPKNFYPKIRGERASNFDKAPKSRFEIWRAFIQGVVKLKLMVLETHDERCYESFFLDIKRQK